MSIYESFFLNPQGEHKKTKIAVALVAILILAGILYWVYPILLGLNQKPDTASLQPTISASSQLPPLLNWVGEIKRLGDKSIMVESTQPTQTGKTKRVITTPSTPITKLAFVPTPDGKRATPVETSIKADALRVGWTVEVLAPTDISQLDEFSAVHIRVLP